MAVRRNSAAGGSHGTTVSTGNSGGASGDAWSTVTLNGGTGVYSNVNPYQGALGYLFTPVSGQSCMVQANETASSSAMVSMMFRMPTLPSATTIYIELRTSGGSAVLATLRVLSDGRVQICDAAGSQVGISGGGELVTVNTQYRFELRAIKGTTSGNGTIHGGFYLGDSTTPIWSFTSSAVNAGTADQANFRIGRCNGVADTRAFQMDAIQWWTGSDTPSALGQPWVPSKIAGLAVTKVTSTSTSVAWTHPDDAPNGVSILRGDGVLDNDGEGNLPSESDYDPTDLDTVEVVVAGRTSSPYSDTGLTPGTYTYWVVRTGP